MASSTSQEKKIHYEERLMCDTIQTLDPQRIMIINYNRYHTGEGLVKLMNQILEPFLDNTQTTFSTSTKTVPSEGWQAIFFLFTYRPTPLKYFKDALSEAKQSKGVNKCTGLYGIIPMQEMSCKLEIFDSWQILCYLVSEEKNVVVDLETGFYQASYKKLAEKFLVVNNVIQRAQANKKASQQAEMIKRFGLTTKTINGAQYTSLLQLHKDTRNESVDKIISSIVTLIMEKNLKYKKGLYALLKGFYETNPDKIRETIDTYDLKTVLVDIDRLQDDDDDKEWIINILPFILRKYMIKYTQGMDYQLLAFRWCGKDSISDVIEGIEKFELDKIWRGTLNSVPIQIHDELKQVVPRIFEKYPDLRSESISDISMLLHIIISRILQDHIRNKKKKKLCALMKTDGIGSFLKLLLQDPTIINDNNQTVLMYLPTLLAYIEHQLMMLQMITPILFL